MDPRNLRLLRQPFPPFARGRGRALFEADAVEFTNVTETDANARVAEHGLDYVVSIRGVDDPAQTTFACSCRLTQPVRCAHVIAVLFALEVFVVELDSAAAAMDDTVTPRSERPRKQPVRNRPGWRQRLGLLVATEPTPFAPPMLEYYVEEPGVGHGGLLLHVRERTRRKDGSLGKLRTTRLAPSQVERLPQPDRQLLAQMQASIRRHVWSLRDIEDVVLGRPWLVELADLPAVVPHLAATGRVFCTPLPAADEVPKRLTIDIERPYAFELLGHGGTNGEPRLLSAVFRRDDRRLAVRGRPLHDTDYLLVDDLLIRVECHGAHRLASELTQRGPIEVDAEDLPQLLQTLAKMRGAAQFLAPVMELAPTPVPQGVASVTFPTARELPLHALLQFEYGDVLVAEHTDQPLVLPDGQVCRRSREHELAIRAAAIAAGLQPGPGEEFTFERHALAGVVTALCAAGLRVLAAGKPVRSFRSGGGSLRSGIDWFELDGAFEFDGRTAQLPELLRKKLTPDGLVELGDGSFGLLPETWMRQVDALRLLGGEVLGDVVRLPNSQGLLLDALLTAREDHGIAVDAQFAALRQKLRAFTQVKPMAAPAAFQGELRPYQQEGLGWLHFLREFGLGGCLADDMGLGKTVQVLALLQGLPRLAAPPPGRKAKGSKRPAAQQPPATGTDAQHRPSLLVAPRSVLGNWLGEVQRFAPDLRIVDFSGANRWRDGTQDRLADCDLVLTTYALARADAPQFERRELRFHYAILDEAQAIKNPDSLSSRAVRLVRARHRLVLTGTPVENHLGDLWSLFEFLNPGMLGRLPAFRALFGRDARAEAMADNRQLVQRALRPVLLRRTKAQVLTDLPDKIEQTLWCELGPQQRRRYQQLQGHYRKLLLADRGELDDQRRFVVLEALLRLRQAACHEGLLAARKADAESAKFEELLPRLEELAAEGHKALVFSQFTSLLDLLEPQLQQRGLAWERLDGRTRQRQRHIDRFQTDPACPLFLISLKAGGYGLNLTAASYVFLLDPWWNPAVEMQAIDRAHRIGQQRVVNAYRVVCRGTVEERVLELQASKRSLSEAILGNERSLLQDLTRADLELLLG